MDTITVNIIDDEDNEITLRVTFKFWRGRLATREEPEEDDEVDIREVTRDCVLFEPSDAQLAAIETACFEHVYEYQKHQDEP